MEKKLMRISNGKKIAGVCNGLAYFFNIDVSIIRIIRTVFVLISIMKFIPIISIFLFFIPASIGIFTSIPILLYIVCWVILPEEQIQIKI